MPYLERIRRVKILGEPLRQLRTLCGNSQYEAGIMRTHRMTAHLQASTKPSAAQTAGLALFLLTCLNLFNFIDRYVLPGVQPLVQKEFGVNDAQIGLLTTAFFFTYMIAAP